MVWNLHHLRRPAAHLSTPPVVSPPEHCAPDAVRDVAFLDTRLAHVRASVHLAGPDDERATKYGPLSPLTVLALDDVLDGKAPSLLDLEGWGAQAGALERWHGGTQGGLIAPEATSMSGSHSTWFVLGFTPDDVIACWQDSRLARECVRAWQDAGRPADFAVLQAPGEDEHMFTWYVNEAAALLLDSHKIDWRRFLVGVCTAPPPGARSALIEDDDARRPG